MNAGTYLDLRKCLQSWTFFKKHFDKKSLTGPVECCFNKPALSFPARRPIMLGSSRTKILEKQVSQEKLDSPEYSIAHQKLKCSWACQKFIAKKLNKIVEPILQKKKLFIEKVSSICRKEVWQSCRKNFSKRTKRFQSVALKPLKFFLQLLSFPEKTFFLENFFCTRRREFWQICRKVFAERPKCLHQIPKVFTKTLLRKSFSRKCPSEHVKSNFVNFEKKPRQISKTILLRYESHHKNIYFLRKNCFSCGTYSAEVGFYFDNAAGKTLQNFDLFHQSPETFWKKVVSPECMFFLKEFFSKTRKQLWKPCQKVFADWPQVLISTSAKVSEVEFFQSTLPQQIFPDPVECCFNKPAASFPARRPLMLGSSRTKILEKHVSQIK